MAQSKSYTHIGRHDTTENLHGQQKIARSQCSRKYLEVSQGITKYNEKKKSLEKKQNYQKLNNFETVSIQANKKHLSTIYRWNKIIIPIKKKENNY